MFCVCNYLSFHSPVSGSHHWPYWLLRHINLIPRRKSHSPLWLKGSQYWQYRMNRAKADNKTCHHPFNWHSKYHSTMSRQEWQIRVNVCRWTTKAKRFPSHPSPLCIPLWSKHKSKVQTLKKKKVKWRSRPNSFGGYFFFWGTLKRAEAWSCHTAVYLQRCFQEKKKTKKKNTWNTQPYR